MLRIKDFSLRFGERIIFQNTNFLINKDEHLCIVGRNGAGKSSLLKILNGEMIPEEGEIIKSPDLIISKLDQNLPENNNISAYNYIKEGLTNHQKLIDDYYALASKEPANDSMLKEIQRLQTKIEGGAGWDLDLNVKTIMTQLQIDVDAYLENLSGGWLRRCALAKALVQKPDLLLLDEPTNHMDLDAIEWLENLIKNFAGAVIFITHDRYFVDQIATKIVEIDRTNIITYDCNYRDYLLKKQELNLIEDRHANLFYKKLKEEEVWIRQGVKARRTRNEGRVRGLESLREEESKIIKRQKMVEININQSEASSKIIIETRNLSYEIDNKQIFNNLNLKITRGEKIGIVGNNGVGKSLLIQNLLGYLKPTTGILKTGENLNLGYFAQTKLDLLEDKSIAYNINDGKDYLDINGKNPHVIGYLKNFLFSAEKSMEPIKNLSGGEKNRVALAKIFSKPTNFLILDEPTNDLDVEMLEVLESSIKDYKGTVLLVTHDRTFLDAVVDKILVFESGDFAEGTAGTAGNKLEYYVGNFSHWQKQNKILATNQTTKKIKKTKKVTDAEKVSGENNLNKEEKQKLRELKKELDRILERVARYEDKVLEIETAMGDVEFYNKSKDEQQDFIYLLQDNKMKIKTLNTRWEELENLLN